MLQKSCWEILGIEPTRDKQNIKRAYARLSRNCHPEDNPEEFRQIHEAYEHAMNMAEFISLKDVYLSQEEDKTSGITAVQDDPATELEQLIRKGLERNLATRTDRLMEKILAIHFQTPDTVNSDQQVFAEAMDRWDELFSSALFADGCRDADFLKELSDWLRENRGRLNRAEAVCFYRFYEFWTVPDKDTYLWEVYVQIMTAAHKYEKDMIRYAVMPLYMRNYGPVYVEAKKKEAKERAVFGLLIICLVILLIASVGTTGLATGEDDRTKDIEVIKVFNHDLVEPHGDSYVEEYAFTRVFPYGYPKSKTELSWENDMPQSLPGVCRIQQRLDDSMPDSISCIQTISGREPGVYEVIARRDAKNQDITSTFYKQTFPDTVIISRFYVERDLRRPGGFKILTDSYLPESFLKIAQTHGIPGAFWIDEDYEQHLILTCDSVERIPELAAGLMLTCKDFVAYHKFNRLRKPLPPMDLTILYGPSFSDMMISGPENDPVIAALMRGTYQPDLPAAHRTYKAYLDTQNNKLDFQPDTAATSSDADSAGSDYWVSHIVFGSTWDVGRHLYPECSYQAVQQHLINSLESLDWIAFQSYE